MQEAKMQTTRLKRLVQGTFVLAFLSSCSSGETQTPAPTGSQSSGETNTTGSPTVGTTNSSSTGQSTGQSQTGTNTSSTSTGVNSGTSSGSTSSASSSASSSTTAPATDDNSSDTSTQTSGGDVDSSTATSDDETDDATSSDSGESATSTSSESETEPGETSDPNAPDVAVFLAGDDVDSNGPLATVQENLSFSGGGHILVRPTTLTSEPNTKHPVAIWGPGGGTPPTDYLQLLTRMASQGFVIVGIRESTGDSVLMSAAIDWLEEQNGDSNSPMYDKLILDRVGVFGHSMGGLSSEATALADDRVATALLDNSGSFSHDALVNVTMPVGIIYGETGQERPNAEGDFNNPENKGPCWLSMMTGGGHGSGPWDGAAANVAWMRWHIGGENSRKNDFIGDGGRYNDNGIWQTDFKNWDGWKNWNE